MSSPKAQKLHSSYFYAATTESDYHHIFDRVYLVEEKVDIDRQDLSSQFTYFDVEDIPNLVQLWNDDEPLSLALIFDFCTYFECELHANSNNLLAMVTKPKSWVKSVFLLGCYMLVKHDIDVDTLRWSFEHLMRPNDLSPESAALELSMEDYWAGLFKAKKLGWVDFTSGGIDQYGAPLDADLQVIVPGKFVAVSSPKELADGHSHQDLIGDEAHAESQADCLLGRLRQLNVRAVVRLDAPEHDGADLVASGIAVADLRIADTAAPSAAAIAKFMVIAEAVPGAVALHCRPDRGLTGTLVALYLMRAQAFTAREALGWVQIVRPGSVSAPQCRFLRDKESLFLRTDGCAVPAAAAAGRQLPAAADAVMIGRLIADAVCAVDRRVNDFRRRRASEAAAAAAGGGTRHDRSAGWRSLRPAALQRAGSVGSVA